MTDRRHLFLAGLFLTTLATVAVEVLDTRLLSVMTWYHLSFFAVSTAMFGMSAGALRVYLGGRAYADAGAVRELARSAFHFALSVPICHLANVSILIEPGLGYRSIAALFVTTIALAVPFYFSGMVVTIALTRIPGRIGLVYFVDLVGAALGSLAVIPLLSWLDATAAVLACGALAAAGAACFTAFDGRRVPIGATVLTAVLAAGAIFHDATGQVSVFHPKGLAADPSNIARERWNVHSQIVVARKERDRPQYWGKGEGADGYRVKCRQLVIDGLAGSTLSQWDGDPDSLEWVQHDVTSLPYHLRMGGAAAVIGVGGGRDVLTALWAGSRSVVGIEINQAFVDLLEHDFRDYAGIADYPGVRLVHDEARSYLTRTDERFDVLQMSLIDTWAATTSGAFTLTENGLYTEEAWRVFLSVLRPQGIFSVSRWFAPESASETSRLIALAVSALLDRGVERPADHLALVTRNNVATLLTSPSPLSAADVETIRRTSERFGFQVLAAPGTTPADPLVRSIVAATSRPELDAATANDTYDYTPPTDDRPFFFNMLEPRAAFLASSIRTPGILGGNLLATGTLLVLAAISALLVLGVILVPLWQSGLPSMDRVSFVFSLAYFGCIGLGFMMVQVPFMQRFSVYLGHPTYAVVVILFSMILMAGVGSLLSDRLPVERRPALLVVLPLVLAALLFGLTMTVQPVIEHTIQLGLLARAAIVVAMVTPVSVGLGFCFPIGMRLVKNVSEDALPWMWGVNGACGVLGAVVAIGVSMWGGIHLNLLVALVLYGSLAVSARVLWKRGRLRSEELEDRESPRSAEGLPADSSDDRTRTAA